MKYLKHTPLIFLLLFCTSAFCQATSKQFLGTWKTKRTDARTFSVTEETWVFLSKNIGTWTRKLIMSEGVVTCDVNNPFTWKITSTNKIEITLGKTNCNCSATKKQFEKGLEDFVKNYKAFYNNGYFDYQIKSIDTLTIKLNDFTLHKQ